MKKLLVLLILILFAGTAKAQSIELFLNVPQTVEIYSHGSKSRTHTLRQCVWDRWGVKHCYDQTLYPPDPYDPRQYYNMRNYSNYYFSDVQTVCLRWKRDRHGLVYCAHSSIR